MFYNILQQEVDHGSLPNNAGVEMYNKQIRKKSQPEPTPSFKKKLKFVSKMCKMHDVLTTERDHIMVIKNYNDNILPQGLLQKGKDGIEAFLEIKKMDSRYEMRPKYKRQNNRSIRRFNAHVI